MDTPLWVSKKGKWGYTVCIESNSSSFVNSKVSLLKAVGVIEKRMSVSGYQRSDKSEQGVIASRKTELRYFNIWWKFIKSNISLGRQWRFCLVNITTKDYLKSSNSTSNLRVARGGITGGNPLSPYATSWVAVMIAFSPLDIWGTHWSQACGLLENLSKEKLLTFDQFIDANWGYEWLSSSVWAVEYTAILEGTVVVHGNKVAWLWLVYTVTWSDSF